MLNIAEKIEPTDLKKLKSSLEATRVNLIALPGSEEALTMTVTSGLNISGLLTNCDPVGLLTKMLLEQSQTWCSTQRLMIWKVQATPSHRLLFRLALLVPRIKGIEFGLLPTLEKDEANHASIKYIPTSQGSNSLSSMAMQGRLEMWPTMTKGDATRGPRYAHQERMTSGKKRGLLLSDCQAQGMQGAFFPTLTKQNGKHTGTQADANRHSNLVGLVGGRLNPRWSEWFMGFPLGWNKLKRLGMQSSLKFPS